MEITNTKDTIDFDRVSVWYPITTLQDAAQIINNNKSLEPVLLYNDKTDTAILFLLKKDD